jgi:hypothetical protein
LHVCRREGMTLGFRHSPDFVKESLPLSLPVDNHLFSTPSHFR